MSEFADKYAVAPAQREISADELRVGQVVRCQYEQPNDEHVVATTFRVAVIDSAEPGVIYSKTCSFYFGPEYGGTLRLIEDIPDPRDALADQLYLAWAAAGGQERAPRAERSHWLAVADKAMTLIGEQR